MKRLYKKYFVCEDGHVTASDEDEKKKCGADLWQWDYVKGKRKGTWKMDKVPTKPCAMPIVKTGTIPSEMDYIHVWDDEVMHAFLIGQRFDSEFMISIQKIVSELYAEVEKIKEKVKKD